LQRIPRDYPRSKSLARASYWTARVLFEKNDIPNACAANASAQAQADSSEVELRNQILYQGQRCPSTTAATLATPTSPAPQTSGAPMNTAATATAKPIPPTNSASPEVAASRGSEKAASPDTVVQAPRPKPPTEANDAKPSIVDPSKAPKVPIDKPTTTVANTTAPTSVKPAASTAAASAATSGYSVQVAAYNHKAEAENLVSTLRKSGYDARVDGSVAPFRVRIGRYPTEKNAEDELKRLKAKRMDGFVVRAPAR
jgi:cell division septation protein DedD